MSAPRGSQAARRRAGGRFVALGLDGAHAARRCRSPADVERRGNRRRGSSPEGEQPRGSRRLEGSATRARRSLTHRGSRPPTSARRLGCSLTGSTARRLDGLDPDECSRARGASSRTRLERDGNLERSGPARSWQPGDWSGSRSPPWRSLAQRSALEGSGSVLVLDGRRLDARRLDGARCSTTVVPGHSLLAVPGRAARHSKLAGRPRHDR